MTEWMMTHPWMTFFLCYTLLEVVNNAIVAVCSAIAACREGKSNKEATP